MWIDPILFNVHYVSGAVTNNLHFSLLILQVAQGDKYHFIPISTVKLKKERTISVVEKFMKLCPKHLSLELMNLVFEYCSNEI